MYCYTVGLNCEIELCERQINQINKETIDGQLITVKHAQE